MAKSRSSLKSKSKSVKREVGLARKPLTHVSPKKAAKKSLKKSTAKQAAGKPARWVYAFGGGKAAGKAGMRNLLGGKGAGLAEMANLGLPVPPGFTITTEVCTHYYANGKKLSLIHI